MTTIGATDLATQYRGDTIAIMIDFIDGKLPHQSRFVHELCGPLDVAAAQVRINARTPRWRAEPPTVDDVKAHAWWWNKPASGNPPHVLQLDVDDAGAVMHADMDDGGVFNPADWPGDWAPAVPPP